jgi:hypothetical protein
MQKEKTPAEKRERVVRHGFMMGSCYEALEAALLREEDISTFIEHLVDLREGYHRKLVLASDDHYNKNFVQPEARRLAIEEIQAILKNMQ